MRNKVLAAIMTAAMIVTSSPALTLAATDATPGQILEPGQEYNIKEEDGTTVFVKVDNQGRWIVNGAEPLKAKMKLVGYDIIGAGAFKDNQTIKTFITDAELIRKNALKNNGKLAKVKVNAGTIFKKGALAKDKNVTVVICGKKGSKAAKATVKSLKASGCKNLTIKYSKNVVK